nr:MAG TPA: hypothetical protein [Caudoviricetes sp.]
MQNNYICKLVYNNFGAMSLTRSPCLHGVQI